jgi:predicted lipoprotein with Yx(FWY)xxD motif
MGARGDAAKPLARHRRSHGGLSLSPPGGQVQQAKENVMLRFVARQKARDRRLWMLLALPAAGSLKTTTIGGATVLTDSKGFTLYSFGLDTSTQSNCNGQCANNWPPVTGSVTAPGVKGTFGTIKRSDGSVQATFNGHPLYTFAADTSPGQAKGNGLTAFGGVWHDDTTSGSAAPAGSPAPGGGGSGY